MCIRDSFYGIRILRRTDTYPTGATDAAATVVWEDYTNPIATTYTDTGLTNGTTYYYAIFTRDTIGNFNNTVTAAVNADTARPGATVTVTNPAAATLSTVYQGQTNNVMQRLNLVTNTGTATLTGLTIRNNGTSTLDSDVSAIRIYRDAGTLGVLDSDTQIGSGAFASDVATISALTESITTTGLNLLIVYDVSANAATGVTIGSQIQSQANLSITGAASVGSFTNFNGQTPTIAGNIVTTANTAVATSIATGATNRVMQKLDFNTNYGTASLSGISVTKLGTMADAQVTSVGIYSDLDNSSAINGSDALVGSGTFTSGVANITLSSAQSITTTPTHYLVVYTISPSATVGSTIGSRIASASALSLAAPDSAAAFTNLDSSTLTLTEAPDTLTVASIAGTNSSQPQGATDRVLNRLSLTASTGNGITLNGLTINKTGTLADSNVTALRLVRDVDQNGTVSAGDVTIGTAAMTSASANFTGLTETLASGASEQLLVVADFLSTATVGATITANIAYNATMASSGVRVAAPDITNNFATITGPTITISDAPDTLSVAQTTVATSNYTAGTNDNLVQVLDLSVAAGNDPVTVSSIQTTLVGAAADIAASGVKLWIDADNSNTLNAGDTQIGTSQTFPAGTNTSVTFSSLNQTIATATSRKLLVTYSIASSATAANTVANQIASAAAITSNADTTSLSATPLTSNTHPITVYIDNLTVTHSAPANYSAIQGSTGQLIDTLLFSTPATGNGDIIDSITLTNAGTALSSDITSVQLYEDTNSNGTLDIGTDIQVDSASLVSGQIVFNNNIALAANTTNKRYFVAANVSSSSVVGRTIQTSLASTGVVVLSPDTVSVTGAPLAGAVLTVSDAGALTLSLIHISEPTRPY
jgi:hypothetical protein